jgi:hypothetical protein
VACAASLINAKLPTIRPARPSTIMAVTIATKEIFSAPVFVILGIDVNAGRFE